MSPRAPYYPCVACNVAMVPEDDSGVSYLRCPQCQGVWIEQPAFFALLGRARPTLTTTELLVHNDGTARRHCPMCRDLMDIAWLDFLQLDQCEEHGVWLDPNELDRALHGDIGGQLVKELKEIEARRNRNKNRQVGPSFLVRLLSRL